MHLQATSSMGLTAHPSLGAAPVRALHTGVPLAQMAEKVTPIEPVHVPTGATLAFEVRV